jgi:hypothetical protein
MAIGFDSHQIAFEFVQLSFSNHKWRRQMPLEAILVVIAVTAMFATFAIVLAWGDRKTRKHEPRRPF